MKTVFYSAIRPATNQSVEMVIQKAQRAGYSMVLFNGWSDADLGMRHGESRGPRRGEADDNAILLREIQDICEVGGDYPHIIQTDSIPAGYDIK